MGGRRFVEGFYQAVFSFRLAGRNVIFKAKRKQSLISGSFQEVYINVTYGAYFFSFIV